MNEHSCCHERSVVLSTRPALPAPLQGHQRAQHAWNPSGVAVLKGAGAGGMGPCMGKGEYNIMGMLCMLRWEPLPQPYPLLLQLY